MWAEGPRIGLWNTQKTTDVLVLYENPAGNRQVSIPAVVQQGADLQGRTA